MNKYYTFGAVMFFIGIFVSLFSEISLTGAVIGVRDADQLLGLAGFAVIFLGIILMLSND